MHGLVYEGLRHIAYQEVPVPVLEQPGDAILRVDVAGLCGSDIHVFAGREYGDLGCVCGHECVGTVVALAEDRDAESGPGPQLPVDVPESTAAAQQRSDRLVGGQPDPGLGEPADGRAPVARRSRDRRVQLQVGDKVVVSFTTACGQCEFCEMDLSARCVRGELLGWRGSGRGLGGAQAEYVRIPLARTSCLPVPPDLTDDEALLLGDILSTALYAAINARVGPVDDTLSYAELADMFAGSRRPTKSAKRTQVYAVVGCGPVGLLTILAARELIALQVEHGLVDREHQPALFALDMVPERLAIAERLGAVPVVSGSSEMMPTLRGVAGSTRHGCDAVMECVGNDDALFAAFDILRPGGILSSIAGGVHGRMTFPFAPSAAYDKNLTFRTGRCPARSLMPAALELLRRVKKRGIDVVKLVVSHRLPLVAGVHAYEIFCERKAGCTKVLLYPGGVPAAGVPDPTAVSM